MAAWIGDSARRIGLDRMTYHGKIARQAAWAASKITLDGVAFIVGGAFGVILAVALA